MELSICAMHFCLNWNADDDLKIKLCDISKTFTYYFDSSA